jgi:hypothetical protein
MPQSITQLGGFWDWLVGPSFTDDEKRALLNQFPALQRRNRELRSQWNDLMNRLEAGERFGNSRTPDLLTQMADLITQLDALETQMVGTIRVTLEAGVRSGRLPESAVRDAGLGLPLPIIALGIVAIAFLIWALPSTIYATMRFSAETQARAYAIKLAAERGEPLPPDTPGPIERTATSLGFTAILVGAALWFFTRGGSRR